MEPLTFQPIYIELVWGGREMERVYGRQLPTPDRPYGESWEIVDREHEQSVVDHGGFAGVSLHDLWLTRREEMFGAGFENVPRFPLLLKILDAHANLSLQVHPPAPVCVSHGGELKNEMWHIAACQPGGKLFVGLKAGVTRAGFEAAMADGSVMDCVHEIMPQPGEAIFIPAGRLHAIGAGLLIHEIQQNSASTFRVFDWNRLGLDGKPRQLHIAESLASIDFHDHEPAMNVPMGETLVACEHFVTTRKSLANGQSINNPGSNRFSILVVVSGGLRSAAGREFEAGRFLLLPRAASPLVAHGDTTVLQVVVP